MVGSGCRAVWAPSWMVWRATDAYVGWLAMPPDYADF
jgi:hypothetical protein